MASTPITQPRGAEPVRTPLDELDAEVTTTRLRVGEGFSSVSGMQGIRNAVEFDGNKDLENEDETGQRIFYVFKAVRDYHELQRDLNVTASAQLGLGVFSGDASASYSRSENHTELDTFLLVGVTVRNPVLVLKKRVLSHAARRLAQGGINDFVQQCGDSYVYGKITGGDLLGVVRYRAQSYELAEKLRVEVNAAGAKWKAGATMSEARKEIHTFASEEYTLLRDGGVGLIPTVDKLIEASLNFPEAVAKHANPVTIKYLVCGYQTVTNFPIHRISLAKLREHSRNFQVEVAHLNEAWERKHELEYVRTHLDEYEIQGDPAGTVDGALAAINDLISRLQKSCAVFIDHLDAQPTNPQTLPALPPKKLPFIVELYRGPNLDNLAYRSNTDIHNFQEVGGDINDQIWSVRINGNPSQYAVDFFIDADYQNNKATYVSPFAGRISTFGPSEYSSLRIRRL